MIYTPYVARNFGIEMEMNEVDIEEQEMDEADIREAICSAVIRSGGSHSRISDREACYYHSDGSTWDVKHDGSCGMGTEYGYEVSSPILRMGAGAENLELKEVCAALTGLRPRINRKCGLHVTVDCADFNWDKMRQLFILWTRYEPFFYSICPPSRSDNHYCRPWRSAVWASPTRFSQRAAERAVGAIAEDDLRYSGTDIARESGLNVTNWWRHGRIEFRLGGGTVNYEKIRRWTQLILSLVGRVRNPYPGMPAIEYNPQFAQRGLSSTYIFKQLGLAPSNIVPEQDIDPEAANLLAWVNARMARFAAARAVAASDRPNGSEAAQARSLPPARRPAATAPRRAITERQRIEEAMYVGQFVVGAPAVMEPPVYQRTRTSAFDGRTTFPDSLRSRIQRMSEEANAIDASEDIDGR